MDRDFVKVGELSFSLITPDDPEILPSLEIENDASSVFETLDVPRALELRDLLNRYLEEARDS